MGSEEIDVVVVGAGQAGLATSHELTARGVPHVVLEQAEAVGTSWAGRWDSFCLVTPNHTIRLPGGQYQGDDPHGFLGRDEIVAHLGDYAARIAAPRAHQDARRLPARRP
jgi:putative flavoprotein involved in K+ transport